MIYKEKVIKIGKFLIHMEYYSKSNDVSLEIMEHQTLTPSGFACNMVFPYDLYHDNRFANQPWLNLFKTKNSASSVPIETVEYIIKYFQALYKHKLFI